MDAKTRKALEGSIQKWERIVADPKAEDEGCHNCPLCEIFLDEMDCIGCPVFAKTGEPCCDLSPYQVWYDHHSQDHNEIDRWRRGDCPECLDLAKAELKFLKSLRPKVKRAKPLNRGGARDGKIGH